jgi:hypothetical protein
LGQEARRGVRKTEKKKKVILIEVETELNNNDLKTICKNNLVLANTRIIQVQVNLMKKGG